jgi:PKD domain
MPNGMGTCETTGPGNCALGGGADGSFCGYHSSTPDGSILYAVIPYNGVNGHCQSGNPRPNGSTADPSLSTLSHEHNETVTDPLGDAWIDGSGNENGDLCIAQYGSNLGGSGAGAWNEVIHGGHYYLQEEWSNADGGCRPRARTISVSWSVSPKIAAHSATTFSGRGRDPNGPVVAFDWSFGDGATGRGRLVGHAYAREGSYQVTLRLTDSAGLRATSTRTIRVTGHARDVKKRSRKKR